MNDDFRDAAADDPTGAGPTEAARTEAMDADAAPPAADWPRIGPYDVIRTLGSGGMGTVYLARQRGSHRPAGGHQGDSRWASPSQLPGSPLRCRAPGAGPHEPPQHRPHLRRRHHPGRRTVLRHGVHRGREPGVLLRPPPTRRSRAARAVSRGRGGRPARPPKGDHPPRPQARKHSGGRHRRSTGAPHHRLRSGQGPGVDDRHILTPHPGRAGGGHPRLHEPGTGVRRPRGSRHSGRRVFAGRHPPPAAGRQTARRPRHPQPGRCLIGDAEFTPGPGWGPRPTPSPSSGGAT
jgi:hypothetical protein